MRIGVGGIGVEQGFTAFKKKIVAKYKKHKMYHFKHFKMYSSVALSASTLLYNHYHRLSRLHHPELMYRNSSSSLSLNGSTLGASCRWSHRVFVLFYLS